MKQIMLLPVTLFPMFLHIFLPIIVLMLCGCAKVKPPQTHYYLLTASSDHAQYCTAPIPTRVELAQFLNQGTLVLQLDEQQIRPSHYQRWGEPLPGLIERYVQRRLQQQLTQTNSTTLTLVIDRFNGWQQGTVQLSGQWWSDTTPPLSFNYQTKQQQPGYHGLVTTLQQLLDTATIDMTTRLQATVNKH